MRASFVLVATAAFVWLIYVFGSKELSDAVITRAYVAYVYWGLIVAAYFPQLIFALRERLWRRRLLYLVALALQGGAAPVVTTLFFLMLPLGSH